MHYFSCFLNSRTQAVRKLAPRRKYLPSATPNKYWISRTFGGNRSRKKAFKQASARNIQVRAWTFTILPISLGSNKTIIMTIERTADAIIVKLPTNIDIEEIQRFLNYLRYKEVVSKSKATQEDVDELAREVNKSWWEKNKQRFLPEE